MFDHFAQINLCSLIIEVLPRLLLSASQLWSRDVVCKFLFILYYSMLIKALQLNACLYIFLLTILAKVLCHSVAFLWETNVSIDLLKVPILFSTPPFSPRYFLHS